MDSAKDELRAIWHQNGLPVILRKGLGHSLKIKLPGRPEDIMWRMAATRWLRSGRHNIPRWDARYRCWDVPQAWLNSLVEQFLHRFGKFYLIQPYREQEKCAPACFNATGHDCQCSCMGANHGMGGPGAGWFTVSDTFATRWGEEQLACRLMELSR
jgi:hypothetical protein